MPNRCSMSYIVPRTFPLLKTKPIFFDAQDQVLNISSQDDPYVEPELFDEIESLIPNCERLSFEKGGHNPQRTHAENCSPKSS